MDALRLLVLFAVACLVSAQDETPVDAAADPAGCPADCECEDDKMDNTYTVTCYEITEFPQLGKMIVIVYNNVTYFMILSHILCRASESSA